ncbi:hypothetical protein CRG98_015355 [Punica granatum]|uniref:Uncharacterized protein n=1 Tax=Punica granatum TaxID=22663 RepID=A0A2I0K6R4_PUNGR|nr:hypothetical protein CRG98_015355 [Punica granatum]
MGLRPDCRGEKGLGDWEGKVAGGRIERERERRGADGCWVCSPIIAGAALPLLGPSEEEEEEEEEEEGGGGGDAKLGGQ